MGDVCYLHREIHGRLIPTIEKSQCELEFALAFCLWGICIQIHPLFQFVLFTELGFSAELAENFDISVGISHGFR